MGEFTPVQDGAPYTDIHTLINIEEEQLSVANLPFSMALGGEQSKPTWTLGEHAENIQNPAEIVT